MKDVPAPVPPAPPPRGVGDGRILSAPLSVAYMVDHLNEVVFRTDCAGRWLFLNSAWTRLTGIPVDESLGRVYTEFVHADDRTPSMDAFTPLIRRERESARMRLRLVLKDGGFRWVAVYLRAVFHPLTGQLDGAVGTIDDVTELMAAERVMREEKERAEAADQTKAQFLASMSHELRTPINAILGLSDVVLQSSLSDEQSRNLALMKDSARNLLEMIDEVLLYSNLETGHLKAEVAPLALTEVLQQVLHPLQQSAGEQRVTLSWRVASDVPAQLEGDPVRIKQLVHHLVGCLLSLARDGTLSLDVQPLQAVAGDSRSLTLEFSLRCAVGLGMEERRQGVISALGQVDALSLRRQGGSALRLVLASRLSTLLGGRIRVEPSSSRELLLRIHLPLGVPAPKPAVADVQREKKSREILVAEDNVVNQHLIRHILQKMGHRFTLVANGRLCVEEWQRRPYDCILMDVQMPEMSGLEATVAIREAEKTTHTHIPIIAVTANVVAGDREQCLACGMDDYVPKPIKNDLLERAIETQCSLRETPVMNNETENILVGPFMDFTEALAGTDDDQDLLRSLMELFLVRTPECVARMETALRAEDAAQVMMQAHSLKGALRMLCTPIFEDLAYRVETAGRTKDLAAAAAGLRDLKRNLPGLYAEINGVLKEKLAAS